MTDSIKPKMNDQSQPQLKYSRGINWTKTNVNTILIWLDVALNQIKLLDYAIVSNRKWIRNNVIFGLALSTASGTLSASNISISEPMVNLVVNVLFTFMSFIIAIMSGYIKVYQIQENLEKYIKIKQDWMVFCIGIITELDLPIKERMDALELINKNKNKYLELLKSDYDIDSSIKDKYAKKSLEGNIKDEDIEKSSKNIQKKDFPSILVSTIFRLQLEFKYLETDGAEEKINIIINSKLRPQQDKLLDKHPEKLSMRARLFSGHTNSPQKDLHITTDTEIYKFKLWQNVKVNYHNAGMWFNGKICKNNDNLTYDVIYDDGEKEENISGSQIKAHHKFKNDQLIEVKKPLGENCSLSDDSNWIFGVVIGMFEDGTYKIRLNDNKILENVDENSIREYYKAKLNPPKFGQGDRVKITISESIYYGIISAIILPKNNMENEIMYNIMLDNGSIVNDITEKNISSIIYCKFCQLNLNDIIDYIVDEKILCGVLLSINENNTFDINISGEIKKNVTRNYIKKHHTNFCKLPSEATTDLETMSHVTEYDDGKKPENLMSKKNSFANYEEFNNPIITHSPAQIFHQIGQNIPSSPKKKRLSVTLEPDKAKNLSQYNALKKYNRK